jgi:hypothetical protein
MPYRVVDIQTAEDCAVSIVVRFHPTNLTIAQYEEVVRREQGTGKFPPDGRDYHVCFGTDGDLHVSEIWDSVEQLQAYGEVLMPILANVGIQFSGEPEVFEAHNIVKST